MDLRQTPPPIDWGVRVDEVAIEALGEAWAPTPFPLPAFDYPGTPSKRPEAWWYDYVTLSVSILACLWPLPGEDMWHVEVDGAWHNDAPAVFGVFTRSLGSNGIDLERFASMTPADGQDFFAGTGCLQMIPERIETLRSVATTIIDRWGGTAANLVADAGRDGSRIADLLSESMPGFQDRSHSDVGELRFDKLSYLCAAIMAAGQGWGQAGFTGYDTFPVYPDYMLPRVFRHFAIMNYSDQLAHAVDGHALIEADSPAELAIRWATIYCGERLTAALASRGLAVSGPALDYRLWSTAVLGPDAANLGEHHRTITLRY